jgi:signal transduction histidine kinase/ActR/RegA family two-component response regulator
MSTSLNVRQTTLNGILFVFLFAALVGAGLSLRMQLAAQGWVEHTLAVRTLLLEALTTLEDAETGQRGFALSADESFLEPFNDARQKLDLRLEQLERTVSDNPVQLERVARLRSLAKAQLSALRESVGASRNNLVSASLEQLKSNKRQMDQARSVIAELMEEEDHLLQTRSADTHRKVMLTEGGGSIALLCAGLLGWANIRDRQRQVADLRAANLALESALAKAVEEAERREQVESQLRHAQKMETLGQLTGGIAHDFNNRLAVIGGCLNLLSRKIARGESDMAPLIEKANETVDRTAKLVHSLLAFSRQQPLEPEVVDCNKIVANMSELILRTLGSSLKVETVLGSGLWRSRVDPHQLESALLNLAVNARDAMSNGGKLTIETGNASIDDEYARQHAEVQAGQYVLVAVTDSGAGMPPEVVAKAFDPFFTTKGPGKGTGLGLSQVFGFVKQSGGHMKIYSEVGLGTTIKIYLPRYVGEGEIGLTSLQSIADTAYRGNPETLVLVVEDEERMRGVAVEMFKELGYSVCAAGNAAHALTLIDANPGIALLFTDIVMPDMAGRVLAEEAVRRRPGLKVIFTTGFTRNAVIHQGVLDSGVNFLAKPFSIEQLGNKVATVLSQPEAAI